MVTEARKAPSVRLMRESLRSGVPPTGFTMDGPNFRLILSTATIPQSLESRLHRQFPSMTKIISPHLHKLPKTIKPEYVKFSSGNQQADIVAQLLKVGHGSKSIIFCDDHKEVTKLSTYMLQRDIPHIAYSALTQNRSRRDLKALETFLRPRLQTRTMLKPTSEAAVPESQEVAEEQTKELVAPQTSLILDDADSRQIGSVLRDVPAAPKPRILVTTSVLSRGLDFNDDVRHVFITQSGGSELDFLHRAGRTGRLDAEGGQRGKVVIFRSR